MNDNPLIPIEREVFAMEKVCIRNRTLTLPKSYDAFLRKGGDFILFKSDDELILKQVQAPDFKRRASTPSKKPPMSMEEINDIIHHVRRTTAKKK